MAFEAKAARAIHVGGDHAAWAQVDREYTLAVELAIYASKAACSWPPRPRCPKKKRPAPGGPSAGKAAHVWLAAKGAGWRCRACLKMVLTAKSKAIHDRRGCGGLAPAALAMLVVAPATGHGLVIAMAAGQPIIDCRRCTSFCIR